MKIKEIIHVLEQYAAPALQEDYDNSGLICGNKDIDCMGMLISLDCTEAIIDEAINRKCNLVICHHPIIFRGLKKINGNNYVERTIIAAIKNDIAIYAIHTNLDNVIHGVNGKIAEKLGLQSCEILSEKAGNLRKLSVFVPEAGKEKLLNALFAAGAGHIGNYAECSFSTTGTGSFKAMEGANPVVGNKGERHLEQEIKVEVIFPSWLQQGVVKAMNENHPYETVAYYIYPLFNNWQETGSGIIGVLPQEIAVTEFMEQLKSTFKVPFVKHTAIVKDKIRRIAVCGGTGSFLLLNAISAGADLFLTADIKYHEFFDADGHLVIADIGHYETEQFTIDLLHDILTQKFTNFAILKTGQNTNPVCYF